ncbi:serine protease inhibitor dipetalogastin-like [Mya arenaria]|uniref:serine protease inhibitor dipetalogastin-like n=1 Tax=Mya arenaria TaxID=6604 RepID=UPI0022DF2854|nr:serine protease inhibitor dipetalogastin-like [Mya arenaria]
MKVVILLAVCVAAAAGSYCSCNSNDVVCTYDNETKGKCEMECDGKEHLINCEGPCPCNDQQHLIITPCGCDNSLKPVCTTIGNNYQNKCQAECNGEVVYYDSYCVKN